MKLVKVIWRDIRTLEPTWKNLGECLTEAGQLLKEEFITVGYLIHQDEDIVLVAATTDGHEYNDVSMILTSVIKDIQEL